MGRRYTADEIETIRINYADWPTFLVAYLVDHTESSVYQQARKLGLCKSEKYLASEWACRLRRGDEVGKSYRYPKGHVPANKGLRRPGYAPGRMASTQFKPGQRGNKWMPIGSYRINADGYRDRKIADTGYPPKDWRGEHILLWEEHLGPLPPKHCICFKNGNKQDIRIDNLACISRAERMRRNTIHRYAPEVKETMRLVGRINREIRKQEREKQDRGSAGPSLRNAGSAARQGRSDGPGPRASDRGGRKRNRRQRKSRERLPTRDREHSGVRVHP